MRSYEKISLFPYSETSINILSINIVNFALHFIFHHMPNTILNSLYRQATDSTPDKITELTGSGSNRRYFRLEGAGGTYIGVIGESTDENKAFIKLANRFADRGLSVPRVVAVTPDRSAYLQDYLGDKLLFDEIENGRTTGIFSEKEKSLLTKTIRSLADIQYRGAEGLDFNVCYPLPEFCRRTVMWDLNYFKYNFLKLSNIPFNESLLEDDFDKLADYLLAEESNTFMYRDFQSRNVMIHDGRPWFIDFQGGRKGPAHYDVASFLWQAKANIPAELREELINEYLDAASQYADIDEDSFKERLQHVVLFRLMQVLGAYGFRGLFEKKLHFLESIPPALMKINELIAVNGFSQYPTLVKVLGQLADKFIPSGVKPDHLTVTIRSFSYKRGIPNDASGNGGGFVFDCRGLHNPGRYDEYKKLTGMDAPVINFLEARGEIQPFLEHCKALADGSVEVYLRRGFTSLTIDFGCTGGQHRSVYCAEKMAEHLSRKYGVDIKLCHREQNVSKRYTTLGQQIIDE